jgi:hypothetical protein
VVKPGIVAELIEDAAEATRVLLKPGDVSDREVGRKPGMVGLALLRDQFDLIVACELR